MSMPALIDLDNWPKTGSGGFLARYNALQNAIPAAPVGDGGALPGAWTVAGRLPNRCRVVIGSFSCAIRLSHVS